MPITLDQIRLKRESAMEKLRAEAAKISTGNREVDERFWSPTVDKAGNGYAVIRFLPAGDDSPDALALPWVRLWRHSFKGSGGLWYIENSRTTIGESDPVAEFNRELWNSTTDDDSPARKQVRNQKRKLTYICNVLVVADKAHPENNGKVFLWKFGKKVFDKIHEVMEPSETFDDEKRLNPFDPEHGANFKLKIRNVENYRNYDKSEFSDEQNRIAETDEEIGAVLAMCMPLQPFVAADQFKPYDELKKKLDRVLGKSATMTADTQRTMNAPLATSIQPRQAPTAVVDDELDEDSLSSPSWARNKNTAPPMPTSTTTPASVRLVTAFDTKAATTRAAVTADVDYFKKLAAEGED